MAHVKTIIPELPQSRLNELWDLLWDKPNAHLSRTLFYQGQTYEFIERTLLELLFPRVFPRYILIREEWKLAYTDSYLARLNKPRHYGSVNYNIAIASGPGTGKSAFLAYILIRRLEDALPTVFQFSNDSLVYFSSTGVQTFTFNSDYERPVICDLARTGGVWCLVRFSWFGKAFAGGERCGVVDDPRKMTAFSWRRMDSRVLSTGVVFTITQGISPGHREWIKDEKTMLCIVDPWKKKEMGALLTQLGLDVDSGLEIFDKYGPCPRTILTILLSEPASTTTAPQPSCLLTSVESSHVAKIHLGTNLLVQSVLTVPSARHLTFLRSEGVECRVNVDDKIKILDPTASDERIDWDPDFRAASRLAWEVLYSILFVRPGRRVCEHPLPSNCYDSRATTEKKEQTAGETREGDRLELQRGVDTFFIPTPFLIQALARAILDESPANQREFFLRVRDDSPAVSGEPCTCLGEQYLELISPCSGESGSGKGQDTGGVKPTVKAAVRWIYRNMVLARLRMAVEEGRTLECVGEEGGRVEFGFSHDVHDDADIRTVTTGSSGSLETQNTTESISTVSPRQPRPPGARPIIWTSTPGSPSRDLPGVDFLFLFPTSRTPSIQLTPPAYDLYIIQALPSSTIPEVCCEAKRWDRNDPLHERLLRRRRDEWAGRDCMPVDESLLPAVASFAGMRTRRSLFRIVEYVRGVRGRSRGNGEGGGGGVVGEVGEGGEGEGERRGGSSGQSEFQPQTSHVQTWQDLLTAHTVSQIKFVVVCPEEKVPQGYMNLLRGKRDMSWATLPEDVIREVDVYASLFEYESVRVEDVLKLMRGEWGEGGRIL